MPRAGGSERKFRKQTAVDDGGGKQERHGQRAGLQPHAGGLRRWTAARHGEMHQRRRHDEVDERRQKQIEELEEGELLLLPNHQGGDVAEGREGAAGIGRDHEGDARDDEERPRLPPDRQGHGAHDEDRGQVVEHARQEEGEDAGDPEEPAVGEPVADEPAAQGVENPTLLERVDVGDGHQEKQQ